MIATLTMLLQLLPQAAVPQQPANGVIEGVVVRADTGAPVAGVRVEWTSSLDPPNLFNGPNPNPPTTTDDSGKFVLRDLKPATYRIAVTANGYVRQEYGQRVTNGTGRSVYVSSGQTVKDLSIALTPAAIVSGRVLTDAGQPAVGILVQLVEAMAGPEGRTYRGAGMANADDRGEFRLYGATPGRYYLVAGNVNVSQRLAPGAGDVISIRMSQTNYGATFYPNAPELGGASLLDVKPGADLRFDLVVKAQQPSYRVSGRVIDAATGQAPAANRIVLSSQFSPLNGVQPMRVGANTITTPGVFEFLNVPPGAWVVRAEVPVQVTPGPVDPAAAEARNAAQAMRPFGQVPFTVTNANVEGLVVTMSTGTTTISGRITVDDARSLLAIPNLDRVSVGFPAAVNSGVSPFVSRPATDGTFRIAGMRDGDYSIRLLGVPAGFYVKAVTYGNQDIWGAPLRFSSSNPAGIEVVLRQGAGQISGRVTDANSQAVPGIQAILIPEPSRRSRTEFYRTVTTDQDGRFSISNVQPGDYKVFSWEGLPQAGYYDPDFMAEYESQGQQVRVVESSNLNLDVKLIPAK